MIIKKYDDVIKVYEKAAQKGWVLPCLCTENQTTTEAILAACSEYGKKIGERVPVQIAITINYSHRPQALNYSACRDWRTGLKLYRDDIAAFAGEGGVYEDVDVLLHLDHAQFDDDAELLASDLSDYSSVMFDASALPFEQNIEATAAFVKKMKGKIFIEGACDEIVDATGTVHNALTTPERAEKYMKETGADVIVANLGTEHRATGKELEYHGEIARAIKERIGTKIVLHGTSSVSNDKIGGLFGDGVCKVNIWTALERDTSAPLFTDMVKHAEKVSGPAAVKALIDAGYLGEMCEKGDKINIGYFTAAYRQSIIFEEMKKLVTAYLELWYR